METIPHHYYIKTYEEVVLQNLSRISKDKGRSLEDENVQFHVREDERGVNEVDYDCDYYRGGGSRPPTHPSSPHLSFLQCCPEFFSTDSRGHRSSCVPQSTPTSHVTHPLHGLTKVITTSAVWSGHGHH